MAGPNQDDPAPVRRGRRPGAGDSREDILRAAREVFGEEGFQRATIRRIGARAGVDAKLVHYYFGSKEDLFSHLLQEAFEQVGAPELLAWRERPEGSSFTQLFLLSLLSTLDQPGLGPVFVGLIRGLGSDEESRQLFLRFISTQIKGQMMPLLPGPDPELRVTLAGAQMLGLVMTRYVVQVPPVSTMSPTELAVLISPTLDRYLFGSLEDLSPSD
ncbi:TetR/AcrR family transcriptional regulator [Scrofimicrobium sp. R131]|uniref:TetR family transcriptional regulator n=1 Tax=Scrofimicrobium appendicitidis TaxID=3079930 RepID=A0AAU7V3S3_9ACTO